ncbi:OsmC family protein [Streptomyces cylindrosporus]|uniref:OsmC family protein n=1 Tax=Streptomyces cylindrosporus TaxID=2927583 RepID=A0ABS9YLS6_9ACTN|nr:OsmC family protein [Streptomyces cylindrosporus]MCI3278225.1 OsmC family protein [Streptomyces cylindrosporus]
MTHTAPEIVSPPGTSAPDVHGLDVTHVHGDAYDVDIRGHRLLVDQPMEAGGTDVAPTPVELFAASLATCVAFYAGRYLKRHGLPRHGLRVHTEFTMAAEPPARVDSLRLTITPPPALSAQRHAALLAVASHCTVHNTLRLPPRIDIGLEPQEP